MPTDVVNPFEQNLMNMPAYYAARASEYDLVYQKPERQADLARLQSWLPPWFAGLRVLEIACGTGYWTQFIAPQAKEMVALDAAPETMAIARPRVAGHRVEFVQGDAYQIPPELGQFDAAFAGFWFSHIPKSRQREFLLGLKARLQPGAGIVLIDNLFVPGSSSPISETDAEGNTWQLRPLADGSTHRVLKNFPDEVELKELVADVGQAPEYTNFGYFWALRFVVG
jgi:demethylmenaquinone methyltransferase/2-methoxy-6-polyprenyl-1,4-benzoquinol methylase